MELTKEGLANLFTKRAVTLTYRTVEIEVMVSSPSEELELAMACALKEKAVGMYEGVDAASL